MKTKVFVVLPTQLFEDVSYLVHFNVYIVEDPFYLNKIYHKQKLYLHHSSMEHYYNYLKDKGINVTYVTIEKVKYDMFINNEVEMYHPVDRKSVKNWSRSKSKFLDPLNFICSSKDLDSYNVSHKNKKKYLQNTFYKWQRIRLNILVNKSEPLYGKWSFDTENRSKFSNNYTEPKMKNNIDITLKNYVEKNYPKSFGYLDSFYYPVNHKEAKQMCDSFISSKLSSFGSIQDAFSKSVTFGNHSVLSSSINIGLLTPQYVVGKVLDYFNRSSNKKNIIASVEGFIRQIIGWREYMRFIYLYHYSEITKIELPLSTKLPDSWYKGTTKLEILNHYIEKVKKYAYLHHIERLMVINNIATMSQFKYKDIYNWFMTCFIDSYDWVMVPNVMMNYNSLNKVSFMSKVYVSTYNYIQKMSDFNDKQDKEIINTLYYNFLKKNKKLLSKDYILAAQIKRSI